MVSEYGIYTLSHKLPTKIQRKLEIREFFNAFLSKLGKKALKNQIVYMICSCTNSILREVDLMILNSKWPNLITSFNLGKL